MARGKKNADKKEKGESVKDSHADVENKVDASEFKGGDHAYRDHMAKWESEKEKHDADKALKSSDEIKDLKNHPKFAKFKRGEK